MTPRFSQTSFNQFAFERPQKSNSLLFVIRTSSSRDGSARHRRVAETLCARRWQAKQVNGDAGGKAAKVEKGQRGRRRRLEETRRSRDDRWLVLPRCGVRSLHARGTLLRGSQLHVPSA